MMNVNSAGYSGSKTYDFELFDTEGANARKKQRHFEFSDAIRGIKHISLAKRGNILFTLIVAAAAIALASANVHSMADDSELASKISSEQLALNEAKNEHGRLLAELDDMVTLSRVEEYAQNELGLQKITPEQVIHISLNTERMTEVIRDRRNILEKIESGFNEFTEYIGI